MIPLVFVAIGGFFGAISRAYFSKKLNQIKFLKLPLGTLFVNVLGSFLLGLLIQLQLSTNLNFLIGIGFLGSFTTFSTFKVESLFLFQEENARHSLIYMLSTYVIGIGMAALGFWIGNLVI